MIFLIVLFVERYNYMVYLGAHLSIAWDRMANCSFNAITGKSLLEI